jgi:hypothetical protein
MPEGFRALEGEAWSLVLRDDSWLPQFVQNIHFASISSPQPWQVSESRSDPPQDPQNRIESGKSRLHCWQFFMTVPFVPARADVNGYPILLTGRTKWAPTLATSKPVVTAQLYSDD